jgi:hypothetical protein
MGSIPGRGPNTPIVGNLQNLRQLQVDDPFLGPIFDARVQGVELLANERFSQHFWVHQEILIFFHPTDGTPKIALPESLAGDVIRSFHEQYGQFGITKVYSLMNRHFFLRKMRARIERFIKSCDVCQRCKFPNRALVGEMHPIIAENPGDLVTVDYYGPLPASRSRVTYIFVVIDAFSKFVRLYPLCRAQAKISAKKIVDDFHRFIPPNKRAFWCKKKYRGEGRNIVYNDESYLHSSHTSPYGWYDRGDNCLLKAPIGKGQRLIMVHCGCEKEFVSNARLMFKSQASQVIITTI